MTPERIASSGLLYLPALDYLRFPMRGEQSMTRSTNQSIAPLDAIDLWTVSLAGHVANESATEVLSNEELSRAGRFVRESDRARYIASHRALRRILARYSGDRPEQLWFERNVFGKPRLGNCAAIEFNMSHSGEIALIAVRTGGRVGVDVEEIRNHSANIEVAERYFAASELQRLKSLDANEQVAAFFRCWTRKEAYLKAMGCGISDEDLAMVEVTLLPDEPPAIVRGKMNGDAAELWTVFHVEPLQRYVGAVVAEGSDLRISKKAWPVDQKEA